MRGECVCGGGGGWKEKKCVCACVSGGGGMDGKRKGVCMHVPFLVVVKYLESDILVAPIQTSAFKFNLCSNIAEYSRVFQACRA